jgi:hypothetical protein
MGRSVIGTLSQHYAGLAFDVGQNLSNSGRATMRNLAVSSGIWNYVEPASDTPTWVHFDERQVASRISNSKTGKQRRICLHTSRWTNNSRV